jgi:hypothetical protein
MKNRLGRLESLVSPSRRKLADHDQGTPFLPVSGDDELSFYLTDPMGFSSFISESCLFLLFSKKPTGLLMTSLSKQSLRGETTRPFLTIPQPLMLRGPQSMSLEVFHHQDLPSVMMT